MAFTPIGYIRTFGLEISLIVIPVAVGAVTLGPVAGLVLGTVFGITSFIQCFGFSAFGAVLLSINPIFTFLVCVPTRALMGWLTGVIYGALSKGEVTRKFACSVSCLLGPILNTVFFMGTLCLCFYQTDYIQGFVTSLGATNPLVFIALFVGVNGVIEAISTFIIGTAVSKALITVMRRTTKSLA
jgi:uncharacterized membrane protein